MGPGSRSGVNMTVGALWGVIAVGWLLTPSGAIANPPPGYFTSPNVCPAPVRPQQAGRGDVTDERTGTHLRLSALPKGAVEVRLTAPEFEFRKSIQPNGDFTLKLAAAQDVAVLIRTGDRLRVTRNGQTAVVRHAEADEAGLEQAQHVLAGSRAMRTFRALHARLSDATLTSAPGIIVDVTDVQAGVLQGDDGVLERRRARRNGRVVRASLGGGEPCFDQYEQEVVEAWDVYSDCIWENTWYPGGPSVCAFVWTIKVEGSWFKYLRCVAFPWKAE